jgi:hypothetical protein
LAGFIARLGILKIESKNRKSLAQRRGFLFERKDIAVPCATIVMTAFVSTNDSLVRMNASLVRMSASFMRMNASLVSTSDLTWPESHSPFMHTNASLMSTNDGFVLTKQTDRAANRYLLSALSTADKSLKTSHSKKSMKNFSTISAQNVTRAPTWAANGIPTVVPGPKKSPKAPPATCSWFGLLIGSVDEQAAFVQMSVTLPACASAAGTGSVAMLVT